MQRGTTKMLPNDKEAQEAKWRKDRIGCTTGSRIYDIVARGAKGQYYATRSAYLTEKVIERMTEADQTRDIGNRPEVQWGNEQEANAIQKYEETCDRFVIHLGKVFVPHPTIPYSGCSPDAYVGDKGGLEVKCPQTLTHWSFLNDGVVPERYMPQVLWQLACHSERDWWDFMSFDPRCPPHMIQRVTRVSRLAYAKEIAALEKEVELFNDEVAFQVIKWTNWEAP
jgi:hypothetical protein